MRFSQTSIATIAFLLSTLTSFAQDTLRLSHAEFLSIVKSYHPLAFRYDLQNRAAEAEIQIAHGHFDPILSGGTGVKTIDGVNYYRESGVGVNIPTWYGIELNGSYNHLEGERLNTSATPGGLIQYGLTVPLAKNLLYDRRRALLDQSRAGRRMTAAEQRLLTNQLLLDADNAYWEWVQQHQVYQLQSEAVAINRERLDFVRKTFEFGEMAAIDTTEALSQLQSFELQLQDAYLGFVKATQELSLFLWTENMQPYELTELLFPSENLLNSEAYTEYATILDQINAQPIGQHAALQYYIQKQNILESERRLKRQGLLPKLDFTYNFFNKQSYPSDYFPLFLNNYQYGLKLEIPMLLRQARGEYRIAQIKARQNQLDADFKRRELNTKLIAYQNEVQNYRGQIILAERNIANYRALLEAEEARLANGESSLFLINTRENRVLDAEQKLLELRLKFLISYNQLKWFYENFGLEI